MNVKPVRVTTLDEGYAQDQAQTSKLDWGLGEAALKAGTLVDEVVEWNNQRLQQFEDDPSWRPRDEEVEFVGKEYSPEEKDYLYKSASQREFQWRAQNIQRHRNDAKELASYGNYGVAATLAIGIADPIGIAAGALSGGVAKAAQLGKVASGVAGLAGGAATGYAMGAFEQAHNTNVTDSDVVLGAILGAAGGAIGDYATASSRAKKIIEDVNDGASAAVNRASGKPVNEPKVSPREAGEASLQKAVDEAPELSFATRRFDEAKATQKATRKAQLDELVTSGMAKKEASGLINKIRGISTDLANPKKVVAAQARLKILQDKHGELVNNLLSKTNEVLEEVRATKADFDIASKVNKDKALYDAMDEAKRDEHWKSTGAARVGDIKDSSVYNLQGEKTVATEVYDKVRDIKDGDTISEAISQNRWGRAMQSIYTRLNSSPSDMVRNLNRVLFENPQGASERMGQYVSESNAALTKDVIEKAMRVAGGGTMVRREAYGKWAKEQGISRIKAEFNPAMQAKFDKQFYYALDSGDNYASASPAIKEAVDSWNKQMEEILKIAKEHDLQGFENIQAAKGYTPKVMNAASVIAATAKYGKEHVIQVIADAYQYGGFKLKPNTAKAVAEMQYNRLTTNFAQSEGFIPTNVNKDQLTKELQAAGVDDETIDLIFEARTDADYKEMMSARAKRSLRPKMFTNGRLQFYDLMNNSAETVMESYIREMAGNIAVKKNLGVSSYRQAKKLMESEKKAILNDLNVQGKLDEADRINEDFDVINDGIDMLYGKSISEPSKLTEHASRLKNITRILMLQMNGLTTLPELVRPVAQNGIRAAISAMPFLSSKRISKLGREDLKEFDAVMNQHGEEYLFEHNSINLEDFEFQQLSNEKAQYDSATLLNGLDRVLNKGARLTQVLSLQRHIQATADRMATRAFLHNVVNKRVTKQQAMDAGWLRPVKTKTEWVQDGVDEFGIPKQRAIETTTEDNFLDELYAFMDANPKSSGGRKMLNAEAMPPEMLRRLQEGSYRLAVRNAQRMMVGELPRFTGTAFGSFMAQFKTFTMASLSKQLIHDLKGGDVWRSGATFVASMGLAYMAMYAKAALKYDEDKHKESFKRYMKKNMEGGNAVLSMITGTGQASSIGLGLNGLATLNILPEDMMASAENGWQGQRGGFMPPSLSVLDNIAKTPASLMKGDTTHAEKLLPVLKTTSVNSVLSLF